ncbi:hypothetical protein [Paenarthrobacter ureafaciens]|nr:hypothetical protein [Paenarthrobacter ureafaciens]GLU58557.1 hypothetical protein Pure01_10700 [Paenarthrobacter ureafaciens]GLU61802.1 hypothetical protein Pure02_00520 [Paenarthrobacter ureafaciens]GLU66076.1 hypothetical protein Pure03_00520 [Paenarthrobacter ureafaciens]GLU71600.1 hypothetical protein Pure04_13150 [Paenarthrobacter ureafaciens]GLU74613.1 hypothetical protein Pure05_00530 [Paenarthrobacter ureafaciens]
MTIENTAGEIGRVSASGMDYDAALAAARELIPDDCKAIVIRGDR